MTTGKIDRSSGLSNNSVAQLKTNGTSSLQPAVQVGATAEVKPSAGPENLFGERSPLLDPKTGGNGKAVSLTASASQLWGQAAMEGSKPPLSALTLKNLSPEQRKAKIADCQKKMSECSARIEGRVGELDQKWQYMGLTKKIETLREYLATTPNLTPEARAEVETAIASADKATAKLDEARAEIKELRPHKATGKNGSPEERKALAQKLLAARKSRDEAVETATAAVDAVGLKIERLALTEDKIDPTGGEKSAFGSLKALVGQFFELTFTMNVLISMSTDYMRELQQDQDEADKRRAIENAWRARDDMMRAMLKDLQLKHLDSRSTEGKKANVARSLKAPAVAAGTAKVAAPISVKASKL
ncbi:MAG: hypothetical protein JNK82_06500 [Myxococcaceae bacterium]|nr:hypothetical protein [Myxococcaceae bacterium]